ncbi:MAG: hypothetical protein ABSA59_12035 [Terriglobia bacterium]|jgi:hypothetical protein
MAVKSLIKYWDDPVELPGGGVMVGYASLLEDRDPEVAGDVQVGDQTFPHRAHEDRAENPSRCKQLQAMLDAVEAHKKEVAA